jgi:hypothetical protein
VGVGISRTSRTEPAQRLDATLGNQDCPNKLAIVRVPVSVGSANGGLMQQLFQRIGFLHDAPLNAVRVAIGELDHKGLTVIDCLIF